MSLSREEIIRMARDAGGDNYISAGNQTLTWFFSDDCMYILFDAAYAAGAAAERELLDVCNALLEAEAEQEDTMARGMLFGCAVEMAREAIRARGNGGEK